MQYNTSHTHLITVMPDSEAECPSLSCPLPLPPSTLHAVLVVGTTGDSLWWRGLAAALGVFVVVVCDSDWRGRVLLWAGTVTVLGHLQHRGPCEGQRFSSVTWDYVKRHWWTDRLVFHVFLRTFLQSVQHFRYSMLSWAKPSKTVNNLGIHDTLYKRQTCKSVYLAEPVKNLRVPTL